MTEISRRNLDIVFGDSSEGSTVEARAESSDQLFVKSQIQLALYIEGATGRVINAREALEAYGFPALFEAVTEGYYPLIQSRNEPSRTLNRRRDDLNLSIHAVAVSSGLTESDVRKAERPGTLNSVRSLERIAQALALDERQIGVVSDAGADRQLGVRLRESDWQRDTASFSERSVSDLAEAAWVVARQSDLMRKLPSNAPMPEAWKHLQSQDYTYPTWRRGYELAANLRQFLDLDANEPILSLRSLLDEQLRIPLIQLSMHERLAGATISNGDTRGIVINEAGRNSNVWVRRMTLAHEIGHLIGDPDYRLNKLRVDDYLAIESGMSSVTRDVVEMRANGFAVAFLAPPEGVKEVVESSSNDYDRLLNTMKTFGISKTAAKHHIKNVCEVDVGAVSLDQGDLIPEDDWNGRESATVDFFPWEETPISRRGLFAYIVTRSNNENLITADTAAELLRISKDNYVAKREAIPSLYDR